MPTSPAASPLFRARRLLAVSAWVTACVTLAVTGCAGGGSALPSGDAAATSAANAAPETVETAAPPVPHRSAGRVTFPWQSGKPQLGIQVYWGDTPNDSDSTVLLKARRMVSYVTSLDANSIVVSFPFHTSGPFANGVEGGSDTPSPARLDSVVRVAQAAGLRVTLRPLLDETSLVAAGPNYWRGNLAPTDPSAWFASYQSFLAPYLTLAARDRVPSFDIGSELTSLQTDPRWDTVVSRARTLYSGQLTYSDNWDVYVQQRVTIPVDQVGVDAYPNMPGLGDNATLGQLVAGWNSWLDKWTSSPLPDSLFYEVGAPAQKGAYRHPGSWGTANSSNLDLAVQQNWFAAACQVAQDRKLAGIYYWRYDMQQDPATADPVHDRTDNWVGRPAAQTIRACFDAWGASAY